MEKALELAAEIPNSFIPQQFENPANPAIHRSTTGIEIWQDTGVRLTYLWQGRHRGTVTGVGELLKSKARH